MKKLLLFLMVISMSAKANTDYQCVNNCTQQGMQYSFCTSRCSWEPAQQTNRTDYQCIAQCTGRGYQYGYCKSACSY